MTRPVAPGRGARTRRAARVAALLALVLATGNCSHESPVAPAATVSLRVEVRFRDDAGATAMESGTGLASRVRDGSPAGAGAPRPDASAPLAPLSPATAGIDSIIAIARELAAGGAGIERARAAIALAPEDTTFRLALEVPPADAYEVAVDARGARNRGAGATGRGTLFFGTGRADSVTAGSSRTVVVSLEDIVPRNLAVTEIGAGAFRLSWRRVARVAPNGQYRVREEPSGREFATPDTTLVPTLPPGLRARDLAARAGGDVSAWARLDASARSESLAPVSYRVRSELADGTVSAFSESVAVEIPETPVCDVSPARIDFGTIDAGDSRDSTFTIANVGGGTLSGDVAEECEPFEVLSGAGPFQLAAGESRRVSVRFAPTTEGALACTIAAGPACDAVILSGTGFVAPQCSVSVRTLDIGTAELGSSRDSSFTITNTGGGRLQGTVSTACATFSIVFNATYDLAARESQEVTVRFHSLAPGAAACTLSTGDGCDPIVAMGTGVPPPACTVSPESLDFGAVSVGGEAILPFTIKNTGGGTLAGAIAEACAEFSVFSGGGPYSLGPGEAVEVLVRFAPSSAGPRSCEVQTGASCAPVSCTGTGEALPECVVEPASIDFGTVTVGSPRDSTFTIRNAGGGTVAGDVSAACNDYATLSGGGAFSLSAGQSREVTVRFTPSSVGASGCQVGLGALCAAVDLRGTGEAAPKCVVTPPSLDFGTLSVGDSRDLSFTIENTGGGTLAGTVSADIGCPPHFAIVSGGGDYALGAGESRAVTIRYQPASTGSHACTILAGSQCDSVPCAGTAIEPPSCFVSETTMDFGAVPQEQFLDRTVTVTNLGAGPLEGAASLVAPCADFSIVAGGEPFSLAQDESLDVIVRFAPTQEGPLSCTLDLGTDYCPSVALLGTGEPPLAPAACSLSTTALDFGRVQIGTPKDLSFTITNTGGETLTGTVDRGTPCSQAVFSIISGSGAFSLAGGETRTVVVRYQPTNTGSQGCTIVAGSACPSVSCTGTGDPPPACGVSTTSLAFGNVLVGASLDKSFTITNTGGGTLSGTVSLTSCSPEFSFVTGGGAYSLTAGQSRTVTVRYTPSGSGTDACTIETGNTLCSDVACTGTGLFPCDVNPTSLAYGNVCLGSYKDRTFTIRNNTASTLTGSITADCPAFPAPAFRITSGGGAYSLSSGASRPVTVRFEADAEADSGTYSCTVETGNATCSDVTCTGTAQFPLCFAVPAYPDSLDFGFVLVGSSADRTFSITNDGTCTLTGTISSGCGSTFAVISGGGSYTLEPEQSRTVTMRFSPTTTGRQTCFIGTGFCDIVFCRGVGFTFTKDSRSP